METHIIRTQNVTYLGSTEDEETTLVVCSCGAQFDEIPHTVRYEHHLIATNVIMKHRIDVLAAKLGIKFEEGTLEDFVHPE